MSIAQAIELFTAINLFTIGLSHFLQPKVWCDFFIFLHSKKQIGNIFNAMLAVGMGSFILSLHFIWEWPQLLVTFYGVLLLLKGLTFLTVPSIGIASIGNVKPDDSRKFRVVGLIMVIFSIGIVHTLIQEGAFSNSF